MPKNNLYSTKYPYKVNNDWLLNSNPRSRNGRRGKVILSLVLAALFIVLLVLSAKAYCWICSGKCTSNMTCSMGCFCHIGSHDFEGICVPK